MTAHDGCGSSAKATGTISGTSRRAMTMDTARTGRTFSMLRASIAPRDDHRPHNSMTRRRVPSLDVDQAQHGARVELLLSSNAGN
ncbi:hypothetical protein ACRQ5Q_34525 [Bradyrhizobium sp. PMVTL-01]|uniref:hypothetical protein n=1 Tax=Bradyrhizobium sp. PMVTL-01 TaxID=3434999 RepID=UPI003F707F35